MRGIEIKENKERTLIIINCNIKQEKIRANINIKKIGKKGKKIGIQ